MTITIELTKGQVTLIDDIDTDLTNTKWHAHAVESTGYYARGNKPNERKSVYLHRIILERSIGRPLTNSELVDHINGNPLDNRRENLRLATVSQNLQNRGKPRNNISGFKGVCWHSRAKKWNAQITVSGKRIYLGLFTTPEAAHEAYCKAARELHGAFANTDSHITVGVE